MSNMPECGCAQDADGNLLSPSKIIWYNDVDDDVLMPVSSSGPSGSSSSSKPMMLAWFFIAPAETGGTRQSSRTTCQSTKILDPDNAESQGFFSSTGMKHKANPTGHAQVTQLSPCLQAEAWQGAFRVLMRTLEMKPRPTLIQSI